MTLAEQISDLHWQMFEELLNRIRHHCLQSEMPELQQMDLPLALLQGLLAVHLARLDGHRVRQTSTGFEVDEYTLDQRMFWIEMQEHTKED